MSNPFTSSRLTYRAIEPEDEGFFEIIGKDVPGYLNSNYSLGKPQSKKQAIEYMKYVEEQALLGVVFCIKKSTQTPEGSSKEELVPVGCIHLSALKPSQQHHRNSMIGIDVLPEYQGQGYGSEAIQWALRWAFEFGALHKVKIGAFGYNAGARRLYERLGFVLEGTRREEVWFNGQFYDMHELGMLDREWRALQEKGASKTAA